MKESIFSFIRGQACSGWDCVYSQDFLVSSFVQTWQSVSEKFIGIPLAINNSKVIWIFCLVLCWYPILASHYPLFSLRRLKFLWTASTKLNHSQQGAFKAVHNQNKLQKLLRLDKKKTERRVAQWQVNVHTAKPLTLKMSAMSQRATFLRYHFPSSILVWAKRFPI